MLSPSQQLSITWIGTQAHDHHAGALHASTIRALVIEGLGFYSPLFSLAKLVLVLQLVSGGLVLRLLLLFNTIQPLLPLVWL